MDEKTALVPVDPNANLLDSSRFAQVQRAAALFAASKLVPAHFRGDMPSVFVIMQMAMRTGVDPFIAMQHTYQVHGKIGLESKFMIGLANAARVFKGPIRYAFKGEGMDRECTAYAVSRVDNEKVEATVTMGQAQKAGWIRPDSMWLKLPDLMLQYRSAAFLIRTTCPEVTMGMRTTDELEDITASNVIEAEIVKNDDVPKSWPTQPLPDERINPIVQGTMLAISADQPPPEPTIEDEERKAIQKESAPKQHRGRVHVKDNTIPRASDKTAEPTGGANA